MVRAQQMLQTNEAILTKNRQEKARLESNII